MIWVVAVIVMRGGDENGTNTESKYSSRLRVTSKEERNVKVSGWTDELWIVSTLA